MAQDGSIEIAIVADDSALKHTLETLGSTAEAALSGLSLTAPEGLFAGVLAQMEALAAQTYQAGASAGTQYAAGLSVGAVLASAAALSITATVTAGLSAGTEGAATSGATIGASFAAGLGAGLPAVQTAAVLLLAGASTTLLAGKPALQQAGLTLGASLAAGLSQSAPQSGSAMRVVLQSATDAARGYQGQMSGVGANLVSGLVAGIRSMAGAAAGALGAVVSSAIATAKAVAGIHSPSRVMRDEVGHMMGLGLALGITRSRAEVQSAMALLSGFAIESAREDASGYAKIGAQYAENLLYGLRAGMDAGDAEFTACVERLFDAYRDENGKLEGANKEAAELLIQQYKEAVALGYDDAVAYVKTRVSELAAVYQEQYDGLIAAQEKLQKRLLAGDTLFSFDKDGMHVENLDASIASIERFGNALDALRQRGASEELLGEIASLKLSEGLEAAEYMLALTDDAFTAMEAKWLEKQQLARDVAAAFYEDQLRELDAAFNQELADALGDVPDALTHIGADTMQGFIDGMMSKTGAVGEAVRAIAQGMLQTMRESLDIHSPSRKTAKLVGEPAAQGIGVGFLAAMDGVYSTMRQAVDSGTRQLSAQSAPAAPEARQSAGSTHVIERETTETVSKIGVDTGSLSGLARELMRVLTIEQQRVGKHIIKGGSGC